MPSTPLSTRSAPSRSTSSASILRTDHAARQRDAGVVERLVDRLVGVVVLDVLADDARSCTSCCGLRSRCSICRQSSMSSGLALQVQLLDDQLVELVLDQAQRHFVDAELLVALLDHRPRLDVAEQGDLLGRRPWRCSRSVRQIRMSGWMPICRSCSTRVLRRLGLGLAGRLEVGDQRQVDVQAVLLADVEGELADGFQERQAFDVADGAADLGDDHVDVVGRPACGRPP